MWFGVWIMTTSPGLLPIRSSPNASLFVHSYIARGARLRSVSFASIHIGVSDSDFPEGKRYSKRLHFGMSTSGNGEEKGIVDKGKEWMIQSMYEVQVLCS